MIQEVHSLSKYRQLKDKFATQARKDVEGIKRVLSNREILIGCLKSKTSVLADGIDKLTNDSIVENYQSLKVMTDALAQLMDMHQSIEEMFANTENAKLNVFSAYNLYRGDITAHLNAIMGALADLQSKSEGLSKNHLVKKLDQMIAEKSSEGE